MERRKDSSRLISVHFCHSCGTDLREANVPFHRDRQCLVKEYDQDPRDIRAVQVKIEPLAQFGDIKIKPKRGRKK